MNRETLKVKNQVKGVKRESKSRFKRLKERKDIEGVERRTDKAERRRETMKRSESF